MASTHFYYSPTTGTGNTVVTVSADTTNTGSAHADKRATITLSNGVNTTSVNVIQRFEPDLVQGPTSIPATGGSIVLTAYSEYPIIFRSTPLWLSVYSGDTFIVSGGGVCPQLTLPGNVGIFTLSAGTNTGPERTAQYEDMNMSHYINGVMYQYNKKIYCTQYANEGIMTDVGEVVFDWNQTTGVEFCVSANTSWTSSIVDD